MEQKLKVFIAGSKVLHEQRKAFRAILMQMQNLWKIAVESKTFEDFPASLSKDGRQKEYNTYISQVADVVVFVFDSKVGGITMQEFNIAYDSFSQSKHPEIFVFCREGSISDNEEIENLKAKLNLLNQYYISYEDNADLDTKFEKHINRYIIDHYVHNTTEKHKASRPNFREWFNSLFKNRDKRHPLTNLVLYLLELGSALGFVFSLFGTFWAFNLLRHADWTFIDIYGKGFIPATLILGSVLYCNTKTLRWEKEGVVLMPILMLIAILPTIWNEFNEFMIFSVIGAVLYLLYVAILYLPYKGNRTIDMCVKASPTLKRTYKIVVTCWFVSITAWPLAMAKVTGFKDNLYENGMRCIDARLNESPYYAGDLAKRIATLDGDWDNWDNAKRWYEICIEKSEKSDKYEYCSDFKDDYLTDCFIHSIHDKCQTENIKELKKHITWDKNLSSSRVRQRLEDYPWWNRLDDNKRAAIVRMFEKLDKK